MVNEQLLRNPCWDIYILSDHELYHELKEQLLNRKGVFIPYLGSSSHPANILKPCEVDLEDVCTDKGIQIHSLFKAASFEECTTENQQSGLDKMLLSMKVNNEVSAQIDVKESPFGDKEFTWREYMPSTYASNYGDHYVELFEFTSEHKAPIEDVVLFKDGNKNLFFF